MEGGQHVRKHQFKSFNSFWKLSKTKRYRIKSMHDKCNFKKWIKIWKSWDIVSFKVYKQNRASCCDYKLTSKSFYNTIFRSYQAITIECENRFLEILPSCREFLFAILFCCLRWISIYCWDSLLSVKYCFHLILTASFTIMIKFQTPENIWLVNIGLVFSDSYWTLFQ